MEAHLNEKLRHFLLRAVRVKVGEPRRDEAEEGHVFDAVAVAVDGDKTSQVRRHLRQQRLVLLLPAQRPAKHGASGSRTHGQGDSQRLQRTCSE